MSLWNCFQYLHCNLICLMTLGWQYKNHGAIDPTLSHHVSLNSTQISALCQYGGRNVKNRATLYWLELDIHNKDAVFLSYFSANSKAREIGQIYLHAEPKNIKHLQSREVCSLQIGIADDDALNGRCAARNAALHATCGVALHKFCCYKRSLIKDNTVTCYLASL